MSLCESSKSSPQTLTGCRKIRDRAGEAGANARCGGHDFSRAVNCPLIQIELSRRYSRIFRFGQDGVYQVLQFRNFLGPGSLYDSADHFATTVTNLVIPGLIFAADFQELL
jgi:hypothetical protein